MRDAIALILGNIAVLLLLVAVVVALAKIRRMRQRGQPVSASYVLWGETIFYTIGLGWLWFGFLHAFHGPLAAAHIGWQSSPFQFELGWGEIGVAVIALMSLWRGYELRLATTVVFAIFSFAAAAQHIHEIACCKNYAPGNAGLILWFGDLALPAFILVLAYLSRDRARHSAVTL